MGLLLLSLVQLGSATLVCKSLQPAIVTDTWCDMNCNAPVPYCPPADCKCTGGGGGSDDDVKPPGSDDDDSSAPVEPDVCAAHANANANATASGGGGSKFELVGYVCPSCPSAPDPAALLADVHEAYTVVNIAFIAWSTDGHVLDQINDPKKPHFNFTREHVAALKKQVRGRHVMVSLGGGLSGVLDCGAPKSFGTNLARGLHAIVDKYGFDGVDFDIEHRSGDFAKCAALLAPVLKSLHASKLRVSLAPQMGNVNPETSKTSAGQNELAPLVGTALQCMTAVMPQMYNTWAAVESVAYAEKYARLATAGWRVAEDGKRYVVKIPPAKLYLGFPCSARGASSGYIAPKDLVAMLKSLRSSGLELGGIMCWSIGWDRMASYAFAKAMQGLATDWARE